MRVAYEHVRLKLQGELARELFENGLESELHNLRFEDAEDASEDSHTAGEIFGYDEVMREILCFK